MVDPESQINGGMSTCPMCGIEWEVTMFNDCMLPACGHYGDDVSALNPDRPCEPCGLNHAWNCPDVRKHKGGKV